jgi:hypothetical protein
MTTLHSFQQAIQRVSRRSLLLGLFGALLLTPVSQAAPIAFTGSLGITFGPPPLVNNPNLLYPDNTIGNEIGIVLTDNSPVDVKITNIAAPTFGGKSNPITAAALSGQDECLGTILGPGGTCGFYIVFDTGNIAPNFIQAAFLQESISAIFSTMKTNGQPLPALRNYSKIGNLTVYDSSISIGDPTASAVPEPHTCALIGLGLIAIGVAGRRRSVLINSAAYHSAETR